MKHTYTSPTTKAVYEIDYTVFSAEAGTSEQPAQPPSMDFNGVTINGVGVWEDLSYGLLEAMENAIWESLGQRK